MFRPRYLAIRSTVTRENLLCLITVVLVLLSGSSGYRQEALVGYSEKQSNISTALSCVCLWRIEQLLVVFSCR